MIIDNLEHIDLARMLAEEECTIEWIKRGKMMVVNSHDVEEVIPATYDAVREYLAA